MKIAILGTGAMGSIYAALLKEAGHEVYAVDLWPEHVLAINQHGLKISGASGDRTIQGIVASTDTDAIGVCELVIIATKASGVAGAAKAMLPLIDRDTLVLTIQNGLGAAERIAQHTSVENLFVGVAQGFGASIVEAGHIHHHSMSLIRIGAIAKPEDSRVEPLVDLWLQAGFTASGYRDIEQLVWEKFICNVAYSGPCTVVGCTIGELLSDPDGTWLSQSCAVEAYQVARAKNINLSFDDPVQYVTEFGNKLGKSRPSMLLDHMANKVSEIDAINGMVPVVAKQHDLPAPVNTAVSAIIRAREAGFGR